MKIQRTLCNHGELVRTSLNTTLMYQRLNLSRLFITILEIHRIANTQWEKTRQVWTSLLPFCMLIGALKNWYLWEPTYSFATERQFLKFPYYHFLKSFLSVLFIWFGINYARVEISVIILALLLFWVIFAINTVIMVTFLLTGCSSFAKYMHLSISFYLFVKKLGFTGKGCASYFDCLLSDQVSGLAVL